MAWESPSELVVSNFREAVMIFCLSSLHGANTYHWEKLGDATRLNTSDLCQRRRLVSVFLEA